MYGTYVKNLKIGNMLLSQINSFGLATVIELSQSGKLVKIRYSNGNECWIDDKDMENISLIEATSEAGA